MFRVLAPTAYERRHLHVVPKRPNGLPPPRLPMGSHSRRTGSSTGAHEPSEGPRSIPEQQRKGKGRRRPPSRRRRTETKPVPWPAKTALQAVSTWIVPERKPVSVLARHPGRSAHALTGPRSWKGARTRPSLLGSPGRVPAPTTGTQPRNCARTAKYTQTLHATTKAKRKEM